MANSEALNQVVQVLSGTLSPDNATRRNSENELKRLASFPGVAAMYFQIIQSDQVSPEIRMSASLALKNFVRDNWSGEGDAPLPEEERESLRKSILEAMFEISATYRRQMSQTVCHIGRYDFPDKWPRLIEVIGEYLAVGNDFDKLVAALSTLEQLVKRYRHEMRSNKLWIEILLVLKAVAEPLTQLYSKMLLHVPEEGTNDALSYADRLSWLEILLLISKIFHSLVSQDLPEPFEDNLAAWMNGFLELLKVKLPDIDDKMDDTEASTLDKLKYVICEVATVFSQRFEDCFSSFTENFIASIWKLLVEIDSRVRFDALVNAALGFLSAICQRQQYSHYFQREGVLQAICENVIIKNLILRNEDIEMYQQEPFEFLKRDIEGSDLETRRRGATDFVRSLCRQFEAQVFQILSGAIVSFLESYQQNPVENFVKKDVVYFLVSAIASKTTTVKYGATSTSQLINVSDFYEQQVRGDLLDGSSNDVPILKSDALKYLVLFRNQLKTEFILECFCGREKQLQSSIIRLLDSQHYILHHYVAYAVERLLLMRSPTGVPILNAENIPVRQLIVSLLNCFKNPAAYNTHYVMKALMRTFSIIDAESARNANVYVEQLERMIIQAIQNPINPQLVHFIFESLCVLIRKAYTKVDGGLDKYVIRIVELIIPKDIVDFVPYALQVIALLLDQSQTERLQGLPVPQEQYLNFFPFLLKGDFWSRSANVPALMLVFESYIRCFPQVVLGPEYIGQVLGCFQRLIALKAQDQHGFRLAAALLPYLDSYDKLTSRELLLPMLNRMQQNKTTKYVRQFVLFMCRFAIVRSATYLATSLEGIQAGLYLMVVEKFFLPELKGMPQTTTYDEKRIVSIGVAALVTETVGVLGALYRPLVEESVSILEAHIHHQKKPATNGDNEGNGDAQIEAQVVDNMVEDDIYLEGNELEYSDPYCKLSYAQHSDTVGKEVLNIKGHLAKAVLVMAHEKAPESVNCLSAKVQHILRSYLTHA